MKYTVIITDAAAREITAQFHYISLVKQEPLSAKRWLEGMYAAVDQLEDFAGHARAPESDFLDVELRQKLFKSHRIIYSLDKSKREVVIHFVRHSARRITGAEE